MKKKVISKIETSSKKGKKSRSVSLLGYRKRVESMEGKIEKFSLSLSDNLLSVKMALMGAARRVEERLRCMREREAR